MSRPIFLRVWLISSACAALAAVRLSASPPPIGDNERLVYRVSWAILPTAGRITVEGNRLAGPAGPAPRFSVTTETETRGLAWLLLPFSARAQSVYDGRTGRLAWYSETSHERSRDSAHTLTFDYASRTVAYADPGQAGGPRILPLPPGDPMDLINSLLSVRTWNLRVGQSRDLLVFFEDDFYLLTVHAVREELVACPLGAFETLVLEPRMEKMPPKGMFKRGSKVFVWVAENDRRRLPVQFQVEFKIVGSGVATLSEYRPPGPVAADSK